MSADWLTAISTGLIAAFTVVLALATILQWRLTCKSLELTRHQFVAAHRPRVIVRYIGEASHDAAKVENVWLYLVNIGETSATIFAAETFLFRVYPGDFSSVSAAPRPQPITPIVLPAGGQGEASRDWRQAHL